MAKRLEMTFKDMENKSMKITVDNVRDGVTDAEVKTAMETILLKDVFVTAAGSLTAIGEAKIVDTSVTELDVE